MTAATPDRRIEGWWKGPAGPASWRFAIRDADAEAIKAGEVIAIKAAGNADEFIGRAIAIEQGPRPSLLLEELDAVLPPVAEVRARWYRTFSDHQGAGLDLITAEYWTSIVADRRAIVGLLCTTGGPVVVEHYESYEDDGGYSRRIKSDRHAAVSVDEARAKVRRVKARLGEQLLRREAKLRAINEREAKKELARVGQLGARA